MGRSPSERMNEEAAPPAALPAWIAFGPERLGDPLGPFPSLAREGRPYNLWLTERILEVLLGRWLGPGGPGPGAAAEDVDRGCGAARRAFREALPEAAALGDPAVLAALAVTANLERTLVLVGERARRRPAPAPPLALSRLWCGIAAYPCDSPWFPAPVRPPVAAGGIDPRRRDPAHLTNALWCSPACVGPRCDEAIAVLAAEMRAGGHYTSDDLRHLHGHSIVARFVREGAARRSGLATAGPGF